MAGDKKLLHLLTRSDTVQMDQNNRIVKYLNVVFIQISFVHLSIK